VPATTPAKENSYGYSPASNASPLGTLIHSNWISAAWRTSPAYGFPFVARMAFSRASAA
jgi:hypothetical protein